MGTDSSALTGYFKRTLRRCEVETEVEDREPVEGDLDGPWPCDLRVGEDGKYLEVVNADGHDTEVHFLLMELPADKGRDCKSRHECREEIEDVVGAFLALAVLSEVDEFNSHVAVGVFLPTVLVL